MNAVSLTLRSVSLFERPVTLRLPFRFGAATVTHCPQAFVRVEAEVGRRRVVGATAELMVPKWFDKAPHLTHEQNFEQLREALRVAREAYLQSATPMTPWLHSATAGEMAIAQGVARGLPRLAAQFGAAQLDKAVADAALRAAGQPWVAGVQAGVLGDPFAARLKLQAVNDVNLRHTVGLADRLTPDDPGADPADGLPATLQAAITANGLRYFKLKLQGRADADIERLTRIASVLEAHATDWRVTLDGNESFADAHALAEFWHRLVATPALQGLRHRTLLLEQPLPRHVALRENLSALAIDVPIILDESDDHAEAFEEGLALGYRGISTKACKGLYRSLQNAVRVAQEPARLILSGEDLTCQAGLAVQQDTILAASLGVSHIERNGHHYVDGFGIAPEAEARAYGLAHAGFYAASSEGSHTTETPACTAPVAAPRYRLSPRAGKLDLTTLHTPGFASAAMPLWDSLTPHHLTRRGPTMPTQKLGIIMHGVTGRMGMNQHLIRSIVAIRNQGGVTLANGDHVMPDPILIGRNAEKIEALAKTHGITRWSTNLGEALANPRDAVFFDAGTTQMRPTLLAQAIRAGKHVYCEKPIATNLNEAVEVCRLAQSSGLKHGAVQDKLFLPGLRKLDMLKRAGFFGKLLSVRIEFGYWVFEGDLQPIQRPSWNYRAEDGGGIILDMVCHWRYVLDNLFGEVKAVSCIGTTHIPQRWDEAGKPYKATADDAAYATFELADGVIAQVNSSWVTRVRRDDLVTFHVDGTHGSAVAGLTDCRSQARVNTPKPVWNPDVRQTIPFFEQWQEVPDTQPYDNGFKIQWEQFIRHVAEDAPYRYTLPEGAKGVQLVEAALQSWKERRWVDVPALSL